MSRDVMVQGRIVWVSGDLFKGKPKLDFNTKQPKIGKDGEAMREYGFGLAVPKSSLTSDPNGIWVAMHEEAYTLFPSRQIPPSFAMKYKDGDGIDEKGNPYSTREGYAGCLVFALTTTLPIKFFKFENGGNIMISEGIKCGDYVNVQVGIKAHPAQGQGKAGLYMNPNAAQFLGYGTAIINAPSGDQIFGGSAPAMPPGASAMPLAPQGGAMLVAPPTTPGYAPTPVAAVPTAPQPHYGVLPQVHQPQGVPMPGVGAAPSPSAFPVLPR